MWNQSNVLITSSGRPLLSDIGLATIVQDQIHNSAYINCYHFADEEIWRRVPPEAWVLSSTDKITREFDVWAFGMLILEVCTFL